LRRVSALRGKRSIVKFWRKIIIAVLALNLVLPSWAGAYQEISKKTGEEILTRGAVLQTVAIQTSEGPLNVYVLRIDLTDPYLKVDTVIGADGTLNKNQPVLVMMAPQKAPQKLYTVNPGTIHEAMMKAKALIIMIKKPRVKIVMGRVKRIRTGLIKVLISPKTRAASRAENTPSIRNPGIRASAINRARLFINSVRTQFIASLPLA
jgi:hypothetical protein